MSRKPPKDAPLFDLRVYEVGADGPLLYTVWYNLTWTQANNKARKYINEWGFVCTVSPAGRSPVPPSSPFRPLSRRALYPNKGRAA